MRRTGTSSVLLCLLVVVGAGVFEAGQPATCTAEEPRLLFWDDLFHPLHVDESGDPWEERIETDRDRLHAVSIYCWSGVGIAEMGYTYFYLDTETETEQSHTTPELLLRLGLTEDIEFRVRWDYAWSSIEQAHHETEYLEGGEDLRWGLKLGVSWRA